MSKVLVVQPDRMLRQAFTLALFPEHEVEMLHGLPGAAPTGVDAVIVDGAALKEFNSITAGELGAIQSWKVPMVWIDNEAASLADRETLVRLNRPVTKAGLQKALAQCLRPSSNADGDRQSIPRPVAAPKKAKPKKPKAQRPAASADKFIELVDVVEEGMATVIAKPEVKEKI